MNTALNILIIGGYGVFGGRIVELLEQEPQLAITIAGRSQAKAADFIKSRSGARAKLTAARFDRDGDIAAQLAVHDVNVVVDASGPFQDYGEGRYRVVETSIARGINYLDLADGSAFVAGVKTFDEAARRAGVFALSGVSSFPVLTAAVVRKLSIGMARVDSISGGIAPSPFAGVGENVIRAIAGYAGQSVALRRDGLDGRGHPFTEHMRCTIAPPGRLPLTNTLFSLVDVPDLRALADLWPEAKSIWMGAGPVPEVLHRLLAGLAWLVRLKLLPSLSFLARPMHFAMNHLRWGEHRGGMFVEVEGADSNGDAMKRAWHLLAEGDDGPLIPSMAVEAIIRNMLAGKLPPHGARPAVRDLELEDYDRLFAGKTIHTGIRDLPAKGALYARILGSAFAGLPEEIRAMHEARAASGEARVERGGSPLAKLAAKLFGFPKPSASIPVAVNFAVKDGVETWTRTFGMQSFSSTQYAGRARADGLLCEAFGPLEFAMALVWNGGKLSLVPRRWRAFGLPMPLWLAPRSKAFETVEDGRFRFHVEISHPLTGLIVRYTGWLQPD